MKNHWNMEQTRMAEFNISFKGRSTIRDKDRCVSLEPLQDPREG
jgi:hypothetical protein